MTWLHAAEQSTFHSSLRTLGSHDSAASVVFRDESVALQPTTNIEPDASAADIAFTTRRDRRPIAIM
jgi:hypothetical protein